MELRVLKLPDASPNPRLQNHPMNLKLPSTINFSSRTLGQFSARGKPV